MNKDKNLTDLLFNRWDYCTISSRQGSPTASPSEWQQTMNQLLEHNYTNNNYSICFNYSVFNKNFKAYIL